MANEVVSPDFFKTNRPDAAYLDEQVHGLDAGIGGGYGVIGYKGKTWSLRLRGEHKTFVRSDDGTPISFIDVVILRAPGNKSKTFYEEGYEEGTSAGKRPTCSSLDGQYPDEGVEKKQSDVCAVCPRNAWKTDRAGRRFLECGDFKRLSVLLMPEQTKELFGEAVVEPVFLRVPAGSLQDLGIFGKQMDGQGWPHHSYVTRIAFDPKVAHPKFTYRAVHALGKDEASLIKSLRDEPLAKEITGENVAERKQAMLPSPETMRPRSIGLVEAQQQVHSTNEVTAPVTDTLAGLYRDPNAPPPTGKLIELSAHRPAQAADLLRSAAPDPAEKPQQHTPAVGQAASDVAEPEESDEFDAEINNLLRT